MKPVSTIRAEKRPAIGKGFASLVILACLGLQTAAIVNGIHPFEEPEVLWPFLNYPMFKQVHGQGEPVNQYILLGIRADSTESEMKAEDFGLNFGSFRGLLAAMRKQNSARLRFYVGLIREPDRSTLAGLRLENHPSLPGKDGPVALPPVVVSAVRVDGEEPVWSSHP